MDTIIKPGKPVVGFDFSTAGAPVIGTMDCEIGPRYKSLLFTFIATAAAGQTLTLADFVAMVTVKVNGKPQRSHLATELDAIQTFWGADYQAQVYNYDTGVINYVNGLPQAAQAGKQTICFLTVWFDEPWRKTWAGADGFAWPTSWADGSVLKALQVELTGSATGKLAANTHITCTCKPEYDAGIGGVDPSTKQPVFLITKWLRNTQAYGGAGDLPLVNLIKKDTLMEMRFFCQAGDDINRVQVAVNSKTVRDVTKGENDALLLGRGALPSAFSVDRFDLIFDHTDKPSSGLVLSANGTPVNDFSVIATLNNATAANKILTVLQCKYGPPD